MDKSIATQTVENYFSYLCAKDAEKWVQLFTPEAVTYDPVGNPPNKVHETYQDFFKLLNFYREVKASPEQVFVAGDEVAVQWQMSVVTQNSKEGNVKGITVFSLSEAGKISQLRAYWDEKELMAQVR